MLKVFNLFLHFGGRAGASSDSALGRLTCFVCSVDRKWEGVERKECGGNEPKFYP